VFINVGDPVAMGLVDSLPRPGRNATGFSDILADLSGKLVDLAKEVDKSQGTIDYLWHTEWPDGQNKYQMTELAAQSLGVKLRSRGIGDNADVDGAIAAIKENGGTALIVQPSPFTSLTYIENGSAILRLNMGSRRYSLSRSRQGRVH
jgi:putative ABC transport system substrate-binding protein